MIDEPHARRPGFVEGPRVALADGSAWALPLRDPDRADPEYDAVLSLIADAEDHADRLRGELALTVFLLTRNYDLNPESLGSLLAFRPNDPARHDLRHALGDIVRLAFERNRQETGARRTTPHAPLRSRPVESS